MTKSLERDHEELTKLFKRAAFEGRQERCEELQGKVGDVTAKIEASKARAAALHSREVEMDSQVMPVWAHLSANALSGATADRISVRTSRENRDVWGGDDRVLERPEGWKQGMAAEARSFVQQLAIGS
mmetsp:Transcript_29988/g.79009  ORF Transcript_29988/g.79009 Transcript_29988/m.79009 type:complete len:128 (-) Transcript_29988:260-643(-)